MAQFHQRSFADRYAAMGDEAESKFQEVHDGGWIEWGLRRPPLRVASLPLKIRYAPDFLTSKGFVEVMGVGKDQLLKLKVEKHIALLQWHQEMPTRLFLWDSTNRRFTYVEMDDLTQWIKEARPGCFPEGKATWELPLKKLKATWTNT